MLSSIQCIVFELLEGNLYELLESNHYNGLSEEVIRIFAVQILSALAFLQQERIIHCDIKP
jgi:serine/threonine protein kinase